MTANDSPPSLDCDVAIVGYGPVGAVLANLLGRDGLRVQAFERDREVYKLPRAVHFDHEIMRIFQSIGLRDTDFPDTAPILGYEFLNGDREVLFRYGIDLEVNHQGWKPDYMFHQPDLERVLRATAERRESVAVHLEHEVTRVEEKEGHVELEVRDLAAAGGPASRTLRARFVVGCDGANSLVRKQAGLTLDDLEFDEPWLVVDATVEKPPVELGLPRTPTQLCDPARPVTYVPVAGPYIRWEFMLLPGETKEEMLRPERIAKLIAEWTDPAAVTVIRSAVYDFHALVANGWGTRRVFLAGDSAHQTPPFLGQGLCTGIRDAANLAWKLRLVLEREAPLALLDSYQPEREPQVRALIGIAVGMGKVICILDPAAAAARDADFLARSERNFDSPPFPPIGPGVRLAEGELAGGLGLQARVQRPGGEATLLDDAFGPGFALIARGPHAPELSAAARDVLARVGGALVCMGPDVDVDGAYARWLERNDCDAVLVRPDHVVFGSARGPDTASTLLEELGHHLTPRKDTH
jgi:3-(3-hydroxy-phenyl)propionate hydroxylase